MSSDHQPRQFADTLVAKAAIEVEQTLRRLTEEVLQGAAGAYAADLALAVEQAHADSRAEMEQALERAREAAEREQQEAAAAAEEKLRQALDAAWTTFEAEKHDADAAAEMRLQEVLDAARADFEAEKHATTEAAAAKLQEALDAARAEFEAEKHAMTEAAATTLQEALDAARADFDTEMEQRMQRAVAAAREEAQAEAGHRIDAALAAAREDDAEAERRVQEALSAGRVEAGAEAERHWSAAINAARDEAENALRAAQVEADRRVNEAVAAQAITAATFGAELEAARAEAAEAQAALAAVQAQAARGPDSTSGGIDRLLDGITRLDAAGSLKECLDVLSEATAAVTSRSMLFVVRGDWLRAWRLSGFAEPVPAAETVVLPMEGAGEFLDVVHTAKRQVVRPQSFGRTTHQALGFARLEEGPVGAAAPVVLDGKTVAVVYADAGGSPGGGPVIGGWPEALDVLARHTSRCLEALTAAKSVALMGQSAGSNGASAGAMPTRTTPSNGAGGESHAGPPAADPVADAEAQTSAERYAKLLVFEIKLYNEAALRVGRTKRDIRSRLRAEIARARRMYDERVATTLPGRDEMFEQELVRVLAEGQPDLLGIEVSEPA